MPNVELRNRVKVLTATSGTGTMTLGAAVAGYKTFANAGVADQETVRYLIEDGTAWEYGIGLYTASGTTLARTTALESSLSSVTNNADIGSTPATKISLSGSAVVSLTVGAEDFRGKYDMWVDQSYMHSALTTGGPSRGFTVTATNLNYVATLDFDPTSVETAMFMIGMPRGYNGGTMTFVPIWSHSDTTTNFGVSWKLSARAFRDNESFDQVMGTAVESADTGGTTDKIYRGPESPAMTVAGSPGPGEQMYLYFALIRDPADSQDNMAIDARLHGIWLIWSSNMATDGLGVADGTPPP